MMDPLPDPLTVQPHERGVIRLFALDLAEEQVAAFANPRISSTGGAEVWPLRSALGVDDLVASGIEVIKIENLGEIGLSGYLTEGQGVSAEALAPYREAIEALTGHAVILHPSALPSGGTIDPRPPVTHIATLREAPPDTPVGDLSADNGPAPAKPAKSAARQSGMVATVALVVMVLLVGLMIWIAA